MRILMSLLLPLLYSSNAFAEYVWQHSVQTVTYEFLPTDTRSSARTACILDAAHLALNEFAMPISVATKMSTTETTDAVDERMQRLVRSQSATPVKAQIVSEAVTSEGERRVLICTVAVTFDGNEYLATVDAVVAAERERYLRAYRPRSR